MSDFIQRLLKRSHRTLVSSSFGLLFPQVYRIIPYSFEAEPMMRGEMIPSNEPSPLYYSFSETGENGVKWSRVKVTPILGLDDPADSGWIYIRHHATEELVEGYYEGIKDFDLWSDEAQYDLSFDVAKTEQGYFTLHRRLKRLPQHDRIAIYAAIRPESREPGYRGEIDEFIVVKPDGSVTNDSDWLYEDYEE